MNPAHRLIALCLCLLPCASAPALIMGAYGNDPVPDRNWRTNAVHLANHKCRVGWWEGPPFGGGEYQFLYRADTPTFLQALTLFSEVAAPERLLYLHDGPQENFYLNIPGIAGNEKKVDARVDFTFTIWDAASFYRLNNDPKAVFGAQSPEFHQALPAPRMDVYIGGGGIDWSKVIVPPNVRVIDQRAAALGVDTTNGPVVVGCVYDLQTSRVLPGATITVTQTGAGKSKPPAGPITTTSDAEGRYRLQTLPAASVQIVASAAGYAPRIVAYEQLSPHAARRYEVSLAPAATASGTVLKPDGAPLPGARIVIRECMGIDGRGYRQPEAALVKTDSQGHFEVKDLPLGYCRLDFFADGFQAVWNPTVHALPVSGVVLKSVGTGTIQGSVHHADGSPNPQVQVHIQPSTGGGVGTWGGSTNVAADGSFTFKNVPAGSYTLATQPFLPGVKPDPDAQTVQVKAGATVKVEMKRP